MKNRIVKNLLPLGLLIISTQAGAENVVGTCKADVVGPHPFTIAGKLYEGKAPDGVHQSMASTRAWMLHWAEEMRPHSSKFADDKAKMANEMMFVLTLT